MAPLGDASRHRSGRRLQHRSLGPRGRAEQPCDRRARCRDLAPPQGPAYLSSLRRRAPPPRRCDVRTRVSATSGWVEQRLTPEGVERVRSRFLSSGLFDSAQPLSDVVSGCGFVHACVRDGDHWLGVQVDVGGPAASHAPARGGTTLRRPQDARLDAARDRVGGPADQALRTGADRGLPASVCREGRHSSPGADRSVHPVAAVPGTSRGAARRP